MLQLRLFLWSLRDGVHVLRLTKVALVSIAMLVMLDCRAGAEVMTYGLGLDRCLDYLRIDPASPDGRSERGAYALWISGFVTGVNSFLDALKRSPVDLGSHNWLDLLDQECSRKPNLSVMTAAQNIVLELQKPR